MVIDNDDGPFLFAEADPAAVAGKANLSLLAGGAALNEGAVASFTIRRSVRLNVACTCRWVVRSSGGAGDLSGTLGGIARWTTGQQDVTVSVQTVARGGTRPARTLRCTISDPSTLAVLVAPTAATRTLNAAGGKAVLTCTGGAAIDEGEVAAFTVTRSTVLGSAVSCHYAASTGNAADLSGTLSGTVSFTANATTRTLNIQSVDRGAGDRAARTIRCTLSAPSANAQLGSPAVGTHQLNATDDGGGGRNRSGLPWKSGVTPGGSSASSAARFGVWRGRPPDCILTYSGGPNWGKGNSALGSAGAQWLKMLDNPNEKPGGVIEQAINAGLLVVHCMAMVVSQEEQDFDMILRGGRDDEHETIAARIGGWYNGKANPPELIFCFAQEGNIRSSNYPWAWKGYANPATYIAAWRRIRAIYKNAIPRAKFSFNSLRSCPEYNTFYPANGTGNTNLVDYITLDAYDNGFENSYFTHTGLAGARSWVDGTWNANGFAGMRGCYNFAKSKDKMFGVQEWGPSSKCNNEKPGDARYIAYTERNPNNGYYMQAVWDFFNESAVTPWLKFECEFNQIDVDHQIEPTEIANRFRHDVCSAAYRRLWTP